MNARAGRSCSQDAAFKFDDGARDDPRAAAALLAGIYQPGLRVLLATLGRDDVQRELAKTGALRVLGDEAPQRSVDESLGRSR
jgi:hypothetical protein